MEWFVLIIAAILIVFNKQFADVLIWWNKFTVSTDFGINPWVYRIIAILVGIFFGIVAIDKLIE